MKTKLDMILREWADKHSPQPDENLELTRGVMRRLREESFRPETLPVPQDTWTWWGRLTYAGIGAAVACAAFLFLGHWSGREHPVPVNGPISSFARISELDLQGAKEVFGAMEGMFQDRLRWVATVDGAVELGIDPDGGKSLISTDAVLVRLVVVARKPGQEWSPVWNTDVLARIEEYVQLEPTEPAENGLALWVHPNVDGTLAVDTAFDLTAPVPLRSAVSSIATPGQPQRLLSVSMDGEEYRVYQIIELLSGARHET